MTRISHREHRELGDVVWLRDFEAAQAQASAQGKPLLLLFQEVPGCSTCVNFGHDVLSQPLLVELIEERFVPVAIFNNHPGADAAVLARFHEASWNNPVAYFLHADGRPIVPKLANRYDPLALHQKILGVLQTLGQPVPDYVELLRRDLLIAYGQTETAIFETPCFWSGETSLAQHPAVLTTEAGWQDGLEVVRVVFDPRQADLAALSEFAQREGFARRPARGFRSDDTPQYYLSKSPLARLALSPAQRTRLNLAVPYDDEPQRFLSPRQQRWLARSDLATISGSDAYRGDFHQQWQRLSQALG